MNFKKIADTKISEFRCMRKGNARFQVLNKDFDLLEVNLENESI